MIYRSAVAPRRARWPASGRHHPGYPAKVTPDLSLPIRVLAAVIALGVPAYAWWARGRSYATFAAVIIAFSLPGALVGHARLTALLGPPWGFWLDVLFFFCLAAAGLHLAHLVRARLRSAAFRLAVSVPGQAFVAAGFLAGWWLLLLLPVRVALMALGLDAALAAVRWLDVVPFGVAVASIATSFGVGKRPVTEWVRVQLGSSGPAEVSRVPVERHRRRAPAPLEQRPLRVVQITDPHLGPWQPISRLHRSIERLLEHEPDLVLCTGDFLTMEGQGSPGSLAQALAPLRAAAGRCYAIFGNHDHEAPAEVRDALERNGVKLLVDEEALAETQVGRVQIVGADYVGRGRREHLHELLARYPRRADHLRLLLLHDPLGFQYIPEDEVDLTLSGHTHGGQVGLVSLGFDWTVLSRSRWPDHGLFARGSNRLYVHRGTGFYGFPLRIGVPGEHSVLELVPAAP